jgi:hypothetical protein
MNVIYHTENGVFFRPRNSVSASFYCLLGSAAQSNVELKPFGSSSWNCSSLCGKFPSLTLFFAMLRFLGATATGMIDWAVDVGRPKLDIEHYEAPVEMPDTGETEQCLCPVK